MNAKRQKEIDAIPWIDDASEFTGDVVAIDFESYYDKDYSLTKLDYRTYCMAEQFDAYIMSAFDGKHFWAGHPSKFNWEALRGKTVVSFNAAFDRTVYELSLGAPAKSPFREWTCCASSAAYVGFFGTLAQVVHELFDEYVSKEVRKEACGTLFDATDIPNSMKLYVAMDSYWAWKIWDRTGEFFPTEEKVLWNHTVEMGIRGVPIDKALLEKYLVQIDEKIKNYSEAIPLTCKGSIKQFREACYAEGIEPPSTTSKASAEFQEWVESNEDKLPWVKFLARYRSAKKMKANLLTMPQRVYWNKEFNHWFMSYSMKYYGATTGRWTGDGGFNMQGMPSDVIEDIDVRKLIVAPAGYKLCVGDYSQIEVRVELWNAHSSEMLEKIRNTKDIYEAFATSFGVYNPEEHGGISLKEYDEKNHSHIRAKVKKLVLGGLYAMGGGGFAKQNNVDLDEANQQIAMFRKGLPRIVSYWADLEQIANKGIHSPKRQWAFTLASGRRIYYRNVFRKLDNYGRWGWAVKLKGIEKTCNKNLYSNNVTQATARDLLIDVIPRLEYQEKYPVILLVHDECVTLVPAKDARKHADKMSAIMCDAPAWAEGLPLEAETDLQDFYHKS